MKKHQLAGIGSWQAISVAAFTFLGMAHHSEAAAIVIDSIVRVTSTVANPVDLTAQGDLDWAYWSPVTGDLLTPPVAPFNDKISGSAIGNLNPVGGGALRGSSTANTVGRYSFTDGAVVPSGTNASLGGLIFNSQLGTAAASTGFQVQVAGDPLQMRVVTLYFGGFGATGELRLTLNGVTDVIDSSQIFPSTDPKQIAIYQIRFQPDSVNDLLTVRYTATDITNPSAGHVGAQAITLAAIPEPSILALSGTGLLILFRRRRRG